MKRNEPAVFFLIALLYTTYYTYADTIPTIPTTTTNRRAFQLVHPVADHSKLQVSDEGLSLLSSITGLVLPVVVIGPYRSGKSFTLNQLMQVPCDVGFGVGHTRLVIRTFLTDMPPPPPPPPSFSLYSPLSFLLTSPTPPKKTSN
jgi:hypothetical protein